MIKTRINDTSIIAISDTHGLHQQLDIPFCDVLICCGDICTDGNEEEIKDFFRWFSDQRAFYKVFCSGNHDLLFELDPEKAKSLIPDDVIYLKNDSKKAYDGIVFHNYDSIDFAKDINEEEINLIINHIPPQGILDNNRGSEFQTELIKSKKFDFGFFGHVHECYGEDELADTKIFNCSSYNYITNPTLSQQLFKEAPRQWGLRGDPEMWRYLEFETSKLGVTVTKNNALVLIKGLFFDLVLKEGKINNDEMIHFKNFDQSGMSGGSVHIPWWKEIGFPFLKKRLEELNN